MDLRRPFLCLSCAHAACLFRDPVREATLPITRGASSAADGAEVGSSHIGVHLAEEAHPYGTCVVLTQRVILYMAPCSVRRATMWYMMRASSMSSAPSGTDRLCGGLPRRSSMLCSAKTLPVRRTADPASHGQSLAGVCRVPRGLRNMGSTCFLNVILQSFIHNPLLRNYFLSDRHNASLCAAGRDCLACEMDKLYAEFFTRSDTPGPHGPTSFLYAIWMDSSSSELSRAGQHDAHEMFISALNGIHSALTAHAHDRVKLPMSPWDDASTLAQLSEHAETPSLGQPRAPDHDASCPCVVHRTFGGRLQSSVTCPTCKRVTHTREPFLDLSLEARADTPAEGRKKKEMGKKRDKATPVPDAATDTLQRCLVSYCAPEQLPEATYRCSYCQQSGRAIKQLKLHTLPPVLCMQLKRYEHALGGAKMDIKVRFPLTLDVRDCCVPRSGDEEVTDPMAYAYDLFTVVVHEGSLHSGHYTNFSKWHSRWYRFDDDKVTPASVAQVLDAKAYQLFYLRRRLWTHSSHGIHVERMQNA